MKSKIYLGKPLIVFLLSVLAIATLISFIVGISVDSVGILRALVLFAAIIIIPLMFFLIGILEWWNSIFGFLVVDDEKMMYTSFRKVKKSINWSEIKEVKKVNTNREEIMELSTKVRYRMIDKKYIAFSCNEIRDNYEDNFKTNFCIFSPDKRIYKAILPHLDKLQEQHRIEIERFFNKEKESKR